jgi:mono/diheme cytochrome c family protein
MFRTILLWMGIGLAGIGYVDALAAQAPASPPPASSSQYRAVLDHYCVTCHNEKLRTAELVLSKMDVGNVGAGAEVWEKVVRKLRTGAMPPAGMPRPDQATYDSFATYLETELDRSAAAKPNPGRIAIHRLNRAEYTNAVRDLLAVEIDGESLLPADESTYGFDNIGDVLSVSPALLERYMSAARKISRLAIGDPSTRLAFETYAVPKLLTQDERISEDLPFGSRGGIAIRHYFPVDGEYVIRIKLQRNSRDYIRGLAEQHQLDVRLDGARIKLFPVGGEHYGKTSPLYSRATPLGDPKQEEYEHGMDEGLEVRFAAKTGTRSVGVAFLDEEAAPEGALQPPLTQFDVTFKGGDPAVESVTIGGPFDAKGLGETASRRKIFACRPTTDSQKLAKPAKLVSLDGGNNDEACAEKILTALAHRAYRRPVTQKDAQTLLAFYRSGRDAKGNGGGFDAGIGKAIERILVGPEFLFRVERDPDNLGPNTAYRVSDLELATRLSFFLWSSIPDDQLLDLAERGKLKDPAVLEQQVRRMLADSRSKALITNFAAQWLNLRTIQRVSPDPETFPDFDENLRNAFQQETELFFESMLREDRGVMDLLNADYTFLNERLARHYGIPNVYGSHFRRVTLRDEARRGLIGQASVLTATSYATRTSPTLRGKWVLENILGAPPPPPPPNVPSLKDRGEDGKILSVRQQMEQHRANPACSVCHTRMDPLGFALENFDAIGKWRNSSGADNTPVDSSGVLPDGTKFNGPAELRKILLRHPQEFVTTVTEKLLTYSLGRGVLYYDAPAIRKITREAAAGNYRWSSIILGVVKSTPFQMRMSSPEAAVGTTAGLR